MQNSSITTHSLPSQSTSTGTALVQAEEVVVCFGKGPQAVLALKGVSMQVHPGEVLGIVGESGSGKSTLARCIMGLVKPVSGQILINGKDHHRLGSRELGLARLEKQMIFQDPYASLNPRMTIFSTLLEALQARQGWKSSASTEKPTKEQLSNRVADLMETVGLDRGAMMKYPHEFSGGQRQRIAIARALAPQPKLLVADEPVSALDVSIQAQILNLLGDIRKAMGLTMIFVSHDLHVVRYLSDRVLVMKRGEIIESGTAAQVMEAPQHPYTQELLAATPHVVQNL